MIALATKKNRKVNGLRWLR